MFKNFTVVAFFLILGAFFTFVSAQRGTFEFTDTNGQCWRCSPGSPCVRCNTIPAAGPIPWPTDCPVPNCNDLIAGGNHLSTVFPSRDSRLFYQCVRDPANPSSWTAIEMQCPCDTLFSYQNQRCDWPWEWQPHCTNLIIPVEPLPCPGPDDTPTPPSTPSTLPSEPTEVPTQPTTETPCVCMPWWPCLCNPCYWMPCHSCGGCMG